MAATLPLQTDMGMSSGDESDSMNVDTPETCAERARQREIAGYLNAASIRKTKYQPADNRDNFDTTKSPATLSKDPTLTALIQLAACRTNFLRGFVSLIDNKHQYTVAEATKTHSLTVNNKCSPGDELYIGVQTIDISWGACPRTMKYFTDPAGQLKTDTQNLYADKSCYIVRDMREDEHFSTCPYVTGHPYIRAYVEVPLITQLGYCIGTMCVVDPECKEITSGTVEILHEIAPLIMKHLELIRLAQNRARSELLVEGLGCFLEQDCAKPKKGEHRDEEYGSSKRSSRQIHRNPDSTSGYPDSRTDPRSEHDLDPVVDHETGSKSAVRPSLKSLDRLTSSATTRTQDSVMFPSSSVDGHPGLETPYTISSANSVSTSPHLETNAPDFSKSVIDRHIMNTSAATQSLDTRHSLVSTDVKVAFARAAELIRRAMNLEGVSFIDACPSSFASRSEGALTPQERGNPFEISSPRRESLSTLGGAGPDPHAPAAVISRAVRDPQRFAQAIRSRDTSFLSELDLQRLIKKYPRGHIFSADSYGPIDERYRPGRKVSGRSSRAGDRGTSQSESIVDSLFGLLKSARYILFLPLWHFQRDTWYSAAFCWIADDAQGFDPTDLTYLSAFGNSLMAEVSRIEALAISRAKSDFISSISHELRSPLHGILASAELLKEALAESEHKPMVSMIESCGRTLLDTMEHLLDFAKINHLSNSAGRSNNTDKQQLARKDKNTIIKTPINFSCMIQDVTEAICIGHASKVAFTQDLQSADQLPTNVEQRPPEHPVLVTLNIEKRTNWQTLAQVGAWKRIVMNLFGNALKYTRQGHIEVSVQLQQIHDAQGTVKPHIVFGVKDTGIGMSVEYQRYFLFQPFAQENILAPGTGLGLSIVKQIVSSMGGRLVVESAIGVGTRITTYIPAELIGTSELTDDSLLLNGDKLKGKKIRILRADEYPNFHSKAVDLQDGDIEHVKALHAAFTSLATTWLDMDILPHNDRRVSEGNLSHDRGEPADFYVVDKAVLGSDKIDEALAAIDAQGKPTILCCYDPPSFTNRLRSGAIRLWHPLGPNKVAAALNEALVAMDSPPSHSPKRICLPSESSIPLTPTMEASDPMSSPKRTLSRPSPGVRSRSSVSFATATDSLASSFDKNITTLQKSASMPLDPASITTEKKPHLLLVDDNPINLKLLSTLATRLKCTYSCATNGLEAVNVFKAETLASLPASSVSTDQVSPAPHRSPYDLVIMDISMPIMNGFAATREIRSFERDLPSTHPHVSLTSSRIVALTGLGNDNDRREAFASGIQVFLTKPAKLAEVRRLLEEVRIDESTLPQPAETRPPLEQHVSVTTTAHLIEEKAQAKAAGCNEVCDGAAQVTAQLEAAIADGKVTPTILGEEGSDPHGLGMGKRKRSVGI